MRTIEEIKADISENNKSQLANRFERSHALITEFLYAVTDEITLDRLEEICNAERDGRLVVLPCKVGDTVYTNFAMQGWYLKTKDRPYPVKVVFIGINDSKEMGYGWMNVKYEKDFMFLVNFSDIGKTVFLTKEQAERALKGGAEC